MRQIAVHRLWRVQNSPKRTCEHDGKLVGIGKRLEVGGSGMIFSSRLQVAYRLRSTIRGERAWVKGAPVSAEDLHHGGWATRATGREYNAVQYGFDGDEPSADTTKLGESRGVGRM